MRHPILLNQANAVLLIVDVQERFRNQIPDFEILTRNIGTLVEACKILKVPIVVTEQYPQGLGQTADEIISLLSDHEKFEKNCFSCCQLEGFTLKLRETGRKQIIVSGIEAHICIDQTVHDLLKEDYDVHLIIDAIASRTAKNKEIGVEKMLLSGAVPSSVEMALFEMLGSSANKDFKSIQKLVK
jgi:nicotinamidase-related amidase